MLIIIGALALIGFIYVVGTERTNIIANIVMTIIGVILPSIALGIYCYAEMGFNIYHMFSQTLNSMWWVWLITIVGGILAVLYLFFVSGEKLEDVFDDFGNKIGVKGGSLGVTVFVIFCTFYLTQALMVVF